MASSDPRRRLTRSLVGVALVALTLAPGIPVRAASRPQIDWPSFRFDLANTGWNPYEHVLGRATVGRLHQHWAAATGDQLSHASPIVANGVVYIGGLDKSLHAFDAATGTLLWTAPTLGWISSAPAVSGGLVFVGSFDGGIYAFNARTGLKRWVYFTRDDILWSSPAVVDGTVYVGSEDGHLYALDAATGHLRWKSAPLGSAILSAPAVVDGVVYVGVNGSPGMLALDAATGQTIWQTVGYATLGAPAVVDGVVYLASGSRIWALIASDGSLVWQSGAYNGFYASPAVANGLVYAGDTNGLFFALDAATGTQRWARQILPFSEITSSAAVANGVVYVGAGSPSDSLYAFDATTGKILWTGATGDAIHSSPAVVNGTVYVGSNDHNVYAFGL